MFPADGGKICADLNKGENQGRWGEKSGQIFFPGRLVTTAAVAALLYAEDSGQAFSFCVIP